MGSYRRVVLQGGIALRTQRPTQTYYWVKFTQQSRETVKAICFDRRFWIPKSQIIGLEQGENQIAVELPEWLVVKKGLDDRIISEGQATQPDPDSRAAYDHWNEEADYHYYSEHPEIFGRGPGYDYPADDGFPQKRYFSVASFEPFCRSPKLQRL